MRVKPVNLRGKRALVTGAARRTGRAMVTALAEAGAEVIIHFNQSQNDATELQDSLLSNGYKASLLQLDLTDVESIEACINDTFLEDKNIDILVNNVGFAVWKDLHELSIEEWQKSLELTVTCTYFCCKAVLPYMRAQSSGHIINMIDADADFIAPTIKATPYKIGKTGVLILTKTLAQTEAEFGIAVNAISPGTLENSELKPTLDDIPAGRYGTYDDIVSALYFLSTCPSYITGNNLKISGGYKL